MKLIAAFQSRAAALAVGAVLFLAILFALAGPSWGLALYRLLQDGGCAVLWLLAAGGIGWLAWRPFRGAETVSVSAMTFVGLGLGIVSLAVLGLGLAGWLNQIWAIAIVGGGGVIAIVAVYPRAKKFDAAKWLRESAGFGWLWLAPAALAGVVALAAFFPPGILWGDEPNGYDVVEYHLQVPREWYEAGRIIPLHHNVFSYFPFNVEMHYLLAMELHGGSWGPWAGMYLAQLMHLGFCVAAVLAVYAFAGGGRRGILAGAIMAVVPWTGLLGAVAYNEGGTLLFGTLAVGWAIRAKSIREFCLAGVFAGFAAGSKLSVAPLLLVGIPVAILIARPRNWRGCVPFVFAALVALSPWLVRNWRWTGNPVFPEGMSVLGHDDFSSVQQERWREAYWPDPKYRSAAGHADALWNEVIADPRFGLLLFPLAIGALVFGVRDRSVVFLWALLVLQAVFWISATHLQSRFMVVVIPIIALMIARIEFPAWNIVVCAAVLIMAALSVTLLTRKLSRFLDTDHNAVALIGRENLEGFRLFDTRQLKDDQSLDLVGDAGAFWYQIPMSRLHYKTVFDVDTSDPKQTIEQAWLAGISTKNAVVWTDSDELKRFARTYFGIRYDERDLKK